MTIYFPVGPPASGKTFLMKSLIEAGWLDPNAIISTDDLRTKLTGNVADQSANTSVFDIIDRMVYERLKRQLDVWHDATNLLPSWRKKAEDTARMWGQPVVYILMTANNTTCSQRNAQRNPPVPTEVMTTMFEHRRTVGRQRLSGHVFTDVVFLEKAVFSIPLPQ